MRRLPTLGIWLFLVACSALPSFVEGVEISVHVFAAQPAKDVTIQSDSDAAPRALKAELAKAVFRTVIAPLHASANGKTPVPLQAAYTLAANWDDGTEQLYLRLGAATPPQVDFEVHHENIGDNYKELQRIEGLGSDYRSMLRKYFSSRAFFRKWQADRTTEAAIRSAKLWFDTAYSLATKKGSVLGMDPDAVKTVNDYEEEARTDPTFRKRLRKHVREGYIQGMLAFISEQEFSLVSRVPELISNGDIETATFINTSLLDKWKKLSPASQGQVIKLHGVNLPLLDNNKEFLLTLQKGPGAG